MPTVQFDPELLTAIHKHGPDITLKELVDKGGLSNGDNISRAVKRHRTQGLINASALSLSHEGARLAGVVPERSQKELPPGSESTAAPGATSVPLSNLNPSSLNPRKVFKQEELEGLADSILNVGLLQNLTVRPVTGERLHSKPYEIVAGERRWRAMQILQDRGDIDDAYLVDVKIRELSDIEVLELAVIENSQREDIHPLEEAEAIAKLQAAKLAEGTKSDARAVCREIADLLGFSERWAQIRVNMVKRLSEPTREAFRSGIFSSVKWADELGRWPHDLQAAAIDEIESGDVRTEAELKDWLRGEALPTGQQCFSGQDYTERGGVLSEPDEDDQVFFINTGIARKLADEYVEAKVQALHQEHGYGGTPRVENWSNPHGYPDIKSLKPKPPKELRTVEAVLDRATLALRVRHPVVDQQAYDAWCARQAGEKALKAEKAKAAENGAGESEATKTEKSEDNVPAEPAKPLSRGHWLAGSKARTIALRAAIKNNSALAMALTIVAVQPTKDHPTPMTRLSAPHVSGDAGQIGAGDRVRGCLENKAKDGFDEDGNITDAGIALASLIADPDLTETLFSHLIADLTIDCDYTAQPGAMPEAQAIAKAELVEDPGGDVVDAEWVKRYTRPQQSAVIDAYDMFLDTEEIVALKKGEASEKIADTFHPDHKPIEARFVSKDIAMALEARLLKGEKV